SKIHVTYLRPLLAEEADGRFVIKGLPARQRAAFLEKTRNIPNCMPLADTDRLRIIWRGFREGDFLKAKNGFLKTAKLLMPDAQVLYHELRWDIVPDDDEYTDWDTCDVCGSPIDLEDPEDGCACDDDDIDDEDHGFDEDPYDDFDDEDDDFDDDLDDEDG
ncbi:MAG: hypothetical protein Q7S89_03105, partial [bacterium]|nr:hypothetical protein [bacterium]